jgi:hypothetical protein
MAADLSADRWLSVPPERLSRWLAGFEERHGPDVTSTVSPEVVTLEAPDGAVAQLHVPFPPLGGDAVAGAGGGVASAYGGLVEHALRNRVVGVLLVRRGGFAAGLFEGRRLLASKVGSRHVQGRTAAGGWSQQRFARRREGQAKVAVQAAADAAAHVLAATVVDVEAMVLGGDRASCTEVLRDPRLASLRPLVVTHRLDVPDPRLRVLQATPDLFRAVRIRIADPTWTSS